MLKDKIDLQITLSGRLEGVDAGDVERFKTMERDHILAVLFESGRDVKLSIKPAAARKQEG